MDTKLITRLDRIRLHDSLGLHLDRATWLALDAVYLDNLRGHMQSNEVVVPVGYTADDEGLTEPEVETVVAKLAELAATRDWVLTPLATRCDGGSDRYFTDCLVRKKMEEDDFIEVRVAMCGAADASKSTSLAVLTHGVLDNGRGSARALMFKHPHEAETGRTSSITHCILGFDVEGNVVNRTNHRDEIEWTQVCCEAAKLITFVDLAGQENFLKTTAFGMTGHRPDYALVFVGANTGALQKIAKEHARIAVSLDIPIAIVVTKIDMAPESIREATVKHVRAVIKSPGVNRLPHMISNPSDVIECRAAFHNKSVVPVFQISNKTGENVDLLRMFLNLLVPTFESRVTEPARFEVDETYTVDGIGTVVSGTTITGVIQTNDILQMGPDSLGEFAPVQVRSIQRHRLDVKSVKSGEMATLALKRVRRTDVRRGMVLAAPEAKPRAAWAIRAEVLVLKHPSTIKRRYQAMVHCGTVRQTAKVTDILVDGVHKDAIRIGSQAVVEMTFVRHPECLEVGSQLVIREGMSKAVGRVVEIMHDAPPYDRNKYRRVRIVREGEEYMSKSERRKRNRKKKKATEVNVPAAAPTQ